jgi:hypothetical protein
MEKAITGKVCCECKHYLHGQLENPCELNNKYVGYLRPACWEFKADNGQEDVVTTKRCKMCGKVYSYDNFWKDCRQPDKHSPYCKECFAKRKKLVARGVPKESKE